MKKIFLVLGIAAGLFALPMRAEAQGWTGYYIGVQGGHSYRAMAGLKLDDDANTDLRGFFGGAQVGGWWQNGTSVYGFNLNYNGADISGSKDLGGEIYSGKIRSFGTLEGRIGTPIFMPNVLIFASGGAAFGSLQGQVVVGGDTFRDSNYRAGFTVGGGFQVAVDQRSSWYVQYKFVNFGTKTFILDDPERVYFHTGLVEFGYILRY